MTTAVLLYLFWPLVVGQGEKSASTTLLRFPVTRDTWVSTAPGETEGNNGGSKRLKLKSCQELCLVDLDPAALAGRVVESAEIHLRSVSDDRLMRVTVSSVSSRWIEGTSKSYDREVGAASFRWSETGRRAWTDDGGDLARVILGAGASVWGFAEASAPDAEGWQTIAVDPSVVRARVAGLSQGFALFDDVGSEYTRDGDQFAYHPFPNRFVASRESGPDSAPYWTIRLSAEDRTAPNRVEGIELGRRGDGVPTLVWNATDDRGPAGVIGYFVRFTTDAEFDWDLARGVPQERVPLTAIGVEHELEIALDRLGLEPKTAVTFGVRAVDGAGNLGPIGTTRVEFPATSMAPEIVLRAPDTDEKVDASRSTTALPKVFAVLDGLDKISLSKDAPLASGDDFLWNASTERIRLSAARNEWVDFQVMFARPFDDLRVSVEFDDAAITAEVSALRGVATARGRFGDPLVPVAAQHALAESASSAPDDRYLGAWVDVFVARDAKRGSHRGRLVVSQHDTRREIEIALHVFGFALPDRLSFVPEMNAYALPPPPEELAWYRLAHEHRTCLNRLAYDWKGRVADGCAPKVVDGAFDWKAYDARFGPLFDGSAFAGSKRANVPVETFYLPINENWPVPIEPHFRGGYWADEALDAEYWAQFSRGCGAFAEHIASAGWNRTLFEFLLNDKVYFKDKSWSRSSAPWIFDEPTHTQDFFALRCFGAAFHAGVLEKRGAAQLVFRADVSRPEWQRDMLDGLLDVDVVGSAFVAYRPLVMQKKRANHEIVFRYATANAVDESNVMPAAWCIETWCLGGDGVIPWQTIGTAKSWTDGDALALLYPGSAIGRAEPVPSVRLKAFRRGQQDVEYLVAWASALGLPREVIGERVLATLSLSAVSSARNAEDAGSVSYPNIDARKLAALRRAIGRQIDALPPRTLDATIGLRTPARDPKRVPKIAPLR